MRERAPQAARRLYRKAVQQAPTWKYRVRKTRADQGMEPMMPCRQVLSEDGGRKVDAPSSRAGSFAGGSAEQGVRARNRASRPPRRNQCQGRLQGALTAAEQRSCIQRRGC